jgi:hypothetical protein
MALPAWGNPWRGKVQAGVISLLGGTTKPTTQPTAQNARHYDELGATYLQRGPLAAVSRSTEELAADALAGRSWRNDAVLSGARMHLYGKRLDGWIYCAPDGSRWLVSTGPLCVGIQTDQPLSVTLSLTRFGEFAGGPAETVNPIAALADLQQTEPDPTFPAGTQAYGAVCDIRPDGSKALVMLYVPVVPFAQNSGFHPLSKRPVGWLELTLSGGVGGITATLTVVRTRAQAFGVGSWSISRAVYVQRWVADDALAIVDMGTYYEYTSTPQPLLTEPFGDGWTWLEGGGPSVQSFTGRILALWYLPNGDLEEVTLDLSVTSTFDNPPPADVVSGSLVQHVFKDGAPTVTISDDRAHYITRACPCTEALSIKLKRGGVLVEEVAGSASSSLTQTRRFIWASGFPFSSTTNHSVTLNGATATDAQSFDNSGPTLGLGAIGPTWFPSAFNGNSAAQAAYRSTDMSFSTLAGFYIADVVRYSNNLLAMRLYHSSNTNGAQTWRHGPAALPGGVHAGAALVPEFSLFGAYNPATGEVLRDQSQATCWI